MYDYEENGILSVFLPPIASTVARRCELPALQEAKALLDESSG
jgi:hypothetical protein